MAYAYFVVASVSLIVLDDFTNGLAELDVRRITAVLTSRKRLNYSQS